MYSVRFIMSGKLFTGIFLFMAGLIFIVGCSSIGNPTVPRDPSDVVINPVDTFPVGVADFDANGNPSSGYGFLGMFEVNINADTLSGEITPVRTTSTTEGLEVVDITNFMQRTPCQDCVKLVGVVLDADGNLVARIGVKHPFPAGNITKPVTGKNRADIHVFNVEGTIIGGPGTSKNFPGLNIMCPSVSLLNADGYSGYLDDKLDVIYPTQADIHPYILHFDDYSQGNFDPANPMGFTSVTDPGPIGKLVMAMGCDYDVKDYVFDLSGGNLDFMLAIGCSYGVTVTSFTQRFFPEYRVPQHNKKAASEVHVDVANDILSGDPGSSTAVTIEVVDISDGVDVGSDRDQMAYDSSVDVIWLEVPGVLTTKINVPLTNIGGNGHSPADALKYEVTVANETSAPAGIYPGAVKVIDSYPTGSNTTFPLTGNDGLRRLNPGETTTDGLFIIPEFATYQMFEIVVIDIITDLPIADLQRDPINILVGETVDFNATASYDPDGTVDLYEFDYDWDGVEMNFVADASNTTGFVTSSAYLTEGIITAGLRVTDNLGAKGYDSTLVGVNVFVNDPPVAVLRPSPAIVWQGNPVNFNGTNSTDSDGTIDLYEFDFIWDGVEANFTPDVSNTTGTALSPSWDILGTFHAGLRVTDNLAAVDYDMVTVQVNEYTGECPDPTFAGYAYSENFTFEDYYSLSDTDWSSMAGAIIDADILSDGRGVCIYSYDGDSIGGEMRLFDVYGDLGFTAVETGYPGEQGVSIDVDSTDIVVFVTCTGYFSAENAPDEWTMSAKLAATNDFFTVVDPAVGSSSEVVVDVGAKIQAIDIDGYDNVWVLDEDNVMHWFVKSTGYTEDISRQFNLDSVTGGGFSGLVFDFVIDFHNECFYVLTNNSPKCDLWRFECDGTYSSTISGNANPLVGVLNSDTQGIADIGIDNLDDSGSSLSGDQDSQIVVVGGYYDEIDVGWVSMVSRVDSDLDQLLTVADTGISDGLGVVMFNQRDNILTGIERGRWAGTWTEIWDTPAGWM
jgi:hypothetical protein